MMQILLNLIGKMTLIITLGYILRKKDIITGQFQTDITDFMMKVALPANVLTTAGNTFSAEKSHELLLTALIAAGYYILSMLLVSLVGRLLPLPERSRVMFGTVVVFANTAFIGFPLATELFGSDGLLYAVIYNMVWILFFFTVGSSQISGQKSGRLRAIFKVPVSVASLAAIALYLSPFRFPAFVQDTLSTLGSMAAPISMLVIGCSLASIHLTDILKNKYAYFATLLRMVAFPLLMLLAVLLIPGIPPMVGLVCCLMTSLPTASLCVVFAQAHHCDPEYASCVTVQSMVLMLVTIPLIMTVSLSLLPL